MDIYSEIILDHYKNPRKKGKLPGANARAQDSNPLCGDKIGFALKIDKSGRIANVRFHGSGCAISQAAASMLAEDLAGKKITQVLKWDKEKVFKLLGVPLSPARAKCALLSLSVVKIAIKESSKIPRKTMSKHKSSFDAKNPYYNLLNKIIDPETQIGIADMGLIYGVKNESGTVKVKMTLTSMGCPAGPQFTRDIDRILRRRKGVKDVHIEIVWEPAWTPDRIKPEFRAVFGF